jgi:two-component system, NarL family, response regulator DegU
MDAFYNNALRHKTKVSVFATYNLVRNYLRLLIEGDRNLSVLDIVGTADDLIDKVSFNKPDVALICLIENEGKDIQVIEDLRRAAPQVKVVILSSPDSLLDQPAALKLGVTGIVGTNQNARVLTRAIQQVSEGEVWLNQKLIERLLNNNLSADGNGSNRNRGFYKEDNLTNRELEVVRMIGLGLKNKDISEKLFISEATVRHHLSSIYSKLHIEDRLNLAIYAYRQKIVSPQGVSV